MNNITFIAADGMHSVSTPAGYQVVAPPLGAVMTVLPPGAQPVIVSGVTYYQINGVSYRPAMQNGVTVFTVVRL